MATCFVSPPLGALYPCLFKPRIRNKGLTSERWEWSISLEASAEEQQARTFVEEIYGIFCNLNPGLRPGKNGLPYFEVKAEDGRGTGIWRFNFSRRQVRGNGSPNLPPMVEDASGAPWPQDLLIGNGSIVKVGFTAWRWNPNGEGGPGIGLELEAVRVLMHADYVPPPPPDYKGCFGGPEPGFLLGGSERPALPTGSQAEPTPQRSFARAVAAGSHASGAWGYHQGETSDDEIPY
jgi:hypothetical protein